MCRKRNHWAVPERQCSRGYDLVSQVDRYADDVAAADIIMLEYGGNDVVAYNAGNI